MSANTQQVRTFTNPSDPMNNVNPFFLFMGLPMDALLLVARYVNYEGFENIALTCQYGNQQFQLLLANERFNRNVRPARQFLMNDRRKELTTLSLNRQLGLPESNSWSTDAIMSANGKWLFILNKSHRVKNRLYCFQQQSTSPLRYRQVGQHHFSGDLLPEGHFEF